MPALVAVGASGGRDSTALLHATLRVAAACGLQVVALHVHHGLSPHADAWLVHLQRQCRRWADAGWPVRLRWQRLQGPPPRGESIENWARRGRYAALAEMAAAEGASIVLLAHHRRDQAETVLLQALRGAGAAGLAAMPRQRVIDGIVFARPWLDLPEAEIAAHVRRWRLTHVQDDSNADCRYARNRLRHQVWPALTGSFPDAETALMLVAKRAQEEAALIEQVAQADLATCGTEDGLATESWLQLTPARRSAALRQWLRPRMPDGVPETLIDRLLHELPGRSSGRWPATAAARLQLYRGVLQWVATDPAPRVAAAMQVDLSRPGRHALPAWQGTMAVRRVRQGGLAAERLRSAELRPRVGGESFQAHAGGPVRSLKKQYQAAGLGDWQRGGPLLYLDGQLAWVPGLGIDARRIAPAGEPQCGLEWQPAAAG